MTAGEVAGGAAGEGATAENATAESAFNDYETFAAAYARTDETSSYRAFYERPAIVSLAGDVRGLRVLDAGCGGGALAVRLGALGAAVTGIDLSAGLLRILGRRDETAAVSSVRADALGAPPCLLWPESGNSAVRGDFALDGNFARGIQGKRALCFRVKQSFQGQSSACEYLDHASPEDTTVLVTRRRRAANAAQVWFAPEGAGCPGNKKFRMRECWPKASQSQAPASLRAKPASGG